MTPNLRARRAGALAPSVAALAVVGAASSGCAAVHPYDDAVESFSRAHACPADRITFVEKIDAPPPEVAADPPRLALWQGARAGKTYFGLEGCRQRAAYTCTPAPERGWPPRSVCVAQAQAETAPPPILDPATRDAQADRAARAELDAITRTLPPGKHVLGVELSREPRGLLVTGVDAGSPADGRLRTGDVIVAAEGVAVSTFAQLWGLEKAHLGMPFELTVGREGALLRVVVRLDR